MDREKRSPVEKKPVFKVGVLEAVTNPKLAEDILDAYESLFDDQSKPTAQLQRCHSREDLRRVLADSSYLKFLALSENDELLSCCIVATNAEDMRVAYANPQRYRRELIEGEKLWYVTALFAVKKVEDSTSKMLEVLAEKMMVENVLLGYDHSEGNAELPNLIRYVVSRFFESRNINRVLDDRELGRQSFRALRLSRN